MVLLVAGSVKPQLINFVKHIFQAHAVIWCLMLMLSTWARLQNVYSVAVLSFILLYSAQERTKVLLAQTELDSDSSDTCVPSSTNYFNLCLCEKKHCMLTANDCQDNPNAY